MHSHSHGKGDVPETAIYISKKNSRIDSERNIEKRASVIEGWSISIYG